MIKKIKQLALDALHKNEARAVHSSEWYEYAGRFCAEIDHNHGLTKGTTAGVVAALSPLNSWQTQVDFTPAIITNGLRLIAQGQRPHAAISLSFFANKDKAARILQGEPPLTVLGGDKVRSFYRNLTGDDDAVTIDRHAVDIAGWTGASHDNKSENKNYARIAFAFRAAAHDIGLTPAGIQALTWCFWRECKAGRAW